MKHQPSITELQNQATITKTEVQAIREELAETKRKQALDHATIEEEKDGRLNEGLVCLLSYIKPIYQLCPLFGRFLNLKTISLFRYEKTFILSGIDLPNPSADRDERQIQLKKAVDVLLTKLDLALSVYKIAYVRVVKSPKPSILEVECDTVDRYICCKLMAASVFAFLIFNFIF